MIVNLQHWKRQIECIAFVIVKKIMIIARDKFWQENTRDRYKNIANISDLRALFNFCTQIVVNYSVIRP